MLGNVPLQTFIDELSFSFNALQLIVNLATVFLFSSFPMQLQKSDSFDFVEYAWNQ